jgi:hypothetical protein
MITCKCPAAASLPDIPAVKCAESFGQIQKVAFQRLTKDDGSKNSFTTEKAITLLASWTPLLSAANSTKIVVSPYIQAPTNEAGAARTFGGGNETLGGVEEIIGREPNPFTGVMRKIPQSVIKAMKELQCESWADNLGVYLFDENGKRFHRRIVAPPQIPFLPGLIPCFGSQNSPVFVARSMRPVWLFPRWFQQPT